MMQSQLMREKLLQWQEREKQWREQKHRALKPVADIPTANAGPAPSAGPAMTMTSSFLGRSIANKENGGLELLTSKKRRLTALLGPPARAERDLHEMTMKRPKPASPFKKEATTSFDIKVERPTDDMASYMAQMQALTNQLATAVAQATASPSPRERELQREVETLRAAHEAELARLAATAKEQAAAIAAVQEEKHALLQAKYKELAVKHTAIKEFLDDAHGDAGASVMPIFNDFEAKLLEADGDGELSELCVQLKREIRKCVVVAKAREEDKHELLFSNQVYLQQINELQQKLIATQRENAALQHKVDESAKKNQELLDDVEQLNSTVVPALEKAMMQNHALKTQLHALKTHTSSSR
ncbi:hypothetical protein SPRG_02671 [Saprolegnia parasitica CBS 223.65]|uniref:Uncharacterized protein n=1 Tax=Saprolegnia parasitica (strain CBS 223.65) TaxID=695850 RepID=A0A067CUN2_SAPPC|nr:hypothetical protein SPRG_02671 [Saprolegnia parasitica CBS 223.65]KDO32980.1 hypothetical protein SPRG_02671 [Saprolegnia parasitica CBS 223.65]|eukprot:XP_012196625.1 hypothetical protein SPRG_02671 [Saprolegnia parasitica CBS 223.65]